MSDANRLHLSWWDRFLISLAPDYGVRRVRARAQAQHMARSFEAAQGGRRTSGWPRSSSDANVANRPALIALRELSRDLRRNNGWAKRGVEVIVNNAVSWGIMPKAGGRSRVRSTVALELWNAWANSTGCDFDGVLNFYGLQRLVMETIVESGEALVLRQPAKMSDGLSFPFRLQVLEPDYLDATRNVALTSGGKIIDGVEFDQRGRRVAYWLYNEHPGSLRMGNRFESVRTPAERVLHIYRVERAGQVRGVPWLSAAITRLKDLDDFEDAELVQQKVAACFGAFVTEEAPEDNPLGAPDEEDDELEHLEPGHVAYLAPGEDVKFAQPPRAQDGAFSERVLRRIAVSLGVTYEDLTADFSNVNFSSARMARLGHWANVHVWREHMLIPQLCEPVWRWAMEQARELKGWTDTPAAQWAAPPMPVLEPDREGLAYLRLVRIGAMTWQQMVRELGYDPTDQLDEIESFNKELDKRDIVLDIDPRRTTAGGQQQQLAASTENADEPNKKSKADEDEEEEEDSARGKSMLEIARGVVSRGRNGHPSDDSCDA